MISAPRFQISPPDVTVPENNGSVQICLTAMNNFDSRFQDATGVVTITAVTGPKDGATNQATGT